MAKWPPDGERITRTASQYLCKSLFHCEPLALKARVPQQKTEGLRKNVLRELYRISANTHSLGRTDGRGFGKSSVVACVVGACFAESQEAYRQGGALKSRNEF